MLFTHQLCSMPYWTAGSLHLGCILSQSSTANEISQAQWASKIFDDAMNPLQLIREIIMADNMDADDDVASFSVGKLLERKLQHDTRFRNFYARKEIRRSKHCSSEAGTSGAENLLQGTTAGCCRCMKRSPRRNRRRKTRRRRPRDFGCRTAKLHAAGPAFSESRAAGKTGESGAWRGVGRCR